MPRQNLKFISHLAFENNGLFDKTLSTEDIQATLSLKTSAPILKSLEITLYKLSAVTAVGIQYPTQMYSNKRSCMVTEMGIHIGNGTSSLTRVGIQFRARVCSIRHGKFTVTGASMQYRTRICSIGRRCAVTGVEINEFS